MYRRTMPLLSKNFVSLKVIREQLFKNIEKAPLKVPTGLSLEAKSLIKGVIYF